MTSESTFPQRFTEIDDLTRSDHVYLTEDDKCYFIGEYTARQGFSYSVTNDLIQNFKKSMDRRDLPEWRYKVKAIRTAAVAFRTALGPLNQEGLNSLTFVPVPPSKTRNNPLYDDRMVKMLNAIHSNSKLDIREMIIQNVDTEAVHGSDVRPAPHEIKKLYEFDKSLAVPRPDSIAIVDDVLTTGAHFRAAKMVLSHRFEGVPIVGLFVARRAPKTDEEERC